MPVATTRKRSRRAMINAGRPVAQDLALNTWGRQDWAYGLGRFMLQSHYGVTVRAAISKENYRDFLRVTKKARYAYTQAQLAGERNIFA